MPEERWRCFVAVPIGEGLRASLTSYVEQLRRSPGADHWRWTDPASWHITLAFLGSISPASVPEITQRLEEVGSRHPPFTVQAGALGAFPSLRHPRVLWLGVNDPSGQLTSLANDIRSAVHVDESSPIRGHVTLARSRQRFGRPDALDSSFKTRLDDLEIAIRRLVLFQSHLGRRPTRYQHLAEHVLARTSP